ncbi:MAG: hypothetical protein MRY79_06005 [Alphaproteobacteria bacterium]|nr:hypothetical protein [Alphaproteobacteria bacterium]
MSSLILSALDTQFKLTEDGTITWQKDLTNPMPGEPVAKIGKGAGLFSPICALVPEAPVIAEAPEQQQEIQAHISAWLGRHVANVLEPLFNLQMGDVLEGPAQDVCDRLSAAMGIIPRNEIQDLIDAMDEEQRQSLRGKKIRFGPILVFLPELNKPAAVRMRAMLLSLWNEKTLPAEVPADGIVSFSVEGKDIDPDYYRSIGYPVYGPRVVRVDMLDRVICAVYDAAKDGKFQAEHKMAEWLGSNIADLYAVLEAMGHKKIYDPQENAEQEKVETLSKEDTEKKTEDVKPELATFRLKRGKASQPEAGKPHKNSSAPQKKKSKKFKKKSNKKLPDKNSATHGRVYKAEVESKPEDSPFAVLQQLQSGSKE